MIVLFPKILQIRFSNNVALGNFIVALYRLFGAVTLVSLYINLNIPGIFTS